MALGSGSRCPMQKSGSVSEIAPDTALIVLGGVQPDKVEHTARAAPVLITWTARPSALLFKAW